MVDLFCNDRHGTAPAGASLFDCAESMGVFVPTSCVTQGKCKECVVEIVEGAEYLSAKTPAERHLEGPFRLSCQAQIVGDEGIVRCHTMRRGTMRIESAGTRIAAVRHHGPIDPCVTRSGDRVLLDGKAIDHATGPLFGLAMDLGTTTVVLRLVDLETGMLVAEASFENPQRFGGSDIMARIDYDTRHRGKLLQRTLAGYVTRAIGGFPTEPESIYELVVVGNATMRDLFFRLDVHSIGQYPYESVTEQEVHEGSRPTTSITARPRRLGLPIHPKGRVYGLPIVTGHVGADAAACMAAVGLAHEEGFVALMDIGTNTELVLSDRGRILAASCPAGPAFEGGRITHGMPGFPGAIEKVRIQDGGTVQISVIGNRPAEGICGSGLIAALAELLRTGRMNDLGRLDDVEEFVLQDRPERRITLHERDISELAQAKGANAAGLRVVFERCGRQPEELDAFYLAGAFGRHIDGGAARRIGLIPDIDDAKIHQVGNAAIEGATLALVSRSQRDELERLVRSVERCRLETHPDFFHYFVEGCQFRPIEFALSSG